MKAPRSLPSAALLAFALLLPSTTPATGAEPPLTRPRPATASPLYRSTDLAVSGRGAHTYRIPALTTLPDGTLVAAYDRRNDSAARPARRYRRDGAAQHRPGADVERPGGGRRFRRRSGRRRPQPAHRPGDGPRLPLPCLGAPGSGLPLPGRRQLPRQHRRAAHRLPLLRRRRPHLAGPAPDPGPQGPVVARHVRLVRHRHPALDRTAAAAVRAPQGGRQHVGGERVQRRPRPELAPGDPRRPADGREQDSRTGRRTHHAQQPHPAAPEGAWSPSPTTAG